MAGRGPAAVRAHHAAPRSTLRDQIEAELSQLNNRLNDKLKEDLSREIYSRNVLKHKEDAVVAQIKVVSSCREVESPDSEVFLTPKASPCTDQNLKVFFVPTEEKKNSRYYSITHVEEDLEKELAEQDSLLSSFRSFLDREVDARKPTTLDFTQGESEELLNYDDIHLAQKRAATLKVLNKQLTYNVDNEMSGAKEEVGFDFAIGGAPSGKDDLEEMSILSGKTTRGPNFVTDCASPNELFQIRDHPNTNNFFIDASSLRDEDELFLPSLEISINNNSSTKREPKKGIVREDEKDNSVEETVNKHKAEKIVLSELNKSVEEQVTNTNAELTLDLGGNPVKMIRRNTFELNKNDDDLVSLREKYEQENNVNKMSVKSEQDNEMVVNAVQGALEEDHSPDSLNMDFQFETFAVESGKCDGEPGIEDKHRSLPASCCIVTSHSNVSDPNSVQSASDVYSNDREGDTTADENTRSSNVTESSSSILMNSDVAGIMDSSSSLSASPLMNRRRNELAPILSGGSDPPIESEALPKRSRNKSTNSMNTSWVVDLNDLEVEPVQVDERRKRNNGGTGFFIPLDDPYPSIDSVVSNCSDTSSSKRSSCGFFIDLKADSDPEMTNKNVKKCSSQASEKKLFSMFIDIGSNGSAGQNGQKTPKSKPSSPFLSSNRRVSCSKPNANILPNYVQERLCGQKKSISTSSDSGLDCGEHPEQIKGKRLFMHAPESSRSSGGAVGSDVEPQSEDSSFSTKRQSPLLSNSEGKDNEVIRRRATVGAHGRGYKGLRHSWNSEKFEEGSNHQDTLVPSDSFNRKQHKRSCSMSIEGNYSYKEIEQKGKKEELEEGGAVDVQKLNRKRSQDKASFDGCVKASSELSRIIQNGARHEFSELRARKNMEHSIEGDGDNSLSYQSESTDENRTFVVDEISKVVNVSSDVGCGGDMELSTPSQDIVSELSKDEPSENDSTGDQTPKQIPSSTAEQPPVPFLAVHEDNSDVINPQLSMSAYVKLSDMDNQILDAPALPSPSKSSRMTRSIPSESSSWFLDKNNLANCPSSKSLSRLFPHLYPKKGVDGSSMSDVDLSNPSSVNSSIGPSPLEVSSDGYGESEDSVGPGCSTTRLGQDLLRMFLEGISPDVTVDVGGRRIKAHKCILSSRCQYFAGILSGGWVESAGNVISLQGFSYNTVHFALCHIYSGTSNIPETINIVELATLADMLCLEGLKEVIMYTLKVKYCHFFHKPCASCIAGVLECLPLAAAYGLDEIYRKSLRWITRYFIRLWPTKGFASLPKELQDKCYKQQIVNMGCDNVLNTIMGCEKLEATLPHVRWALPVLNMNTKLHEAAVKYLTQHFSLVISNDAFLRIGKEDVWTLTKLEETMLAASRNLSPDQSCQSYKKIKIVANRVTFSSTELDNDDEWRLEFLELLGRLETSIEDCLVRQAGRAARTSSWAQMDLALRKKIQEMACLVFTPGPRSASVSKMRDSAATSKLTRPSSERTSRTQQSYHLQSSNSSSKVSSPIVQRASSAGSCPAPTRSLSTTSVTASSAISTAAKPNNKVSSSIAPKKKSPLPSRPLTASNISANTQSSLPRPKTNQKLSQVKSRYLEPKQSRKQLNDDDINYKDKGGMKIISSSDSSRTSSPAMSRVTDKSRPKTAGAVPSSVRTKTTKSIAPGSGGNVSTVGGGGGANVKSNRSSTLRVPTKSSQAKVTAASRTNSNPTATIRGHPAITTRSGTFLKDSSAPGQASKTTQQPTTST